MQFSLKQHIINHIFENRQDFQLHNNTVDKFRAYIYNQDGEYLEHGGEEVSDFIKEAIQLIVKEYVWKH